MRIFLDECVDWRLSRDFSGHEVKTPRQMGWSGLKNGDLLALASSNFDVFVTVDRNLPFQQDISSFPFAIIILRAKTNRLGDLQRLVPRLLAAIHTAKAGTVVWVGD